MKPQISQNCKMGLGSGIRKKPIPDPGSGSATLLLMAYYLSAARDLLSLGVDGNAVDGVLEEHVAAVLEYGAGGVVQLVGVCRRLEYLHRPPRLCHTLRKGVRDNSAGFGTGPSLSLYKFCIFIL
jgi:hypothetical protein